MSTDATTPSNATLDDIINNAKNSSDMVESLRAYNIAVASKELTPQPAARAASTEPSGKTNQFFEVLYPSGSDRIEISAATDAEFQRKKAAVLAAYKK
jgi:hypothetical protein